MSPAKTSCLPTQTPADLTRIAVVTQARGYLGAPFKHQGRTRAGLDCAGLVLVVAGDLGYVGDFDFRNYPRTPRPAVMRQILRQWLDPVPLCRHEPGDVLYMKFRKSPTHLAIATPAGIIHAFHDLGRVVEHSLDGEWLACCVEAYRFRGIC